MNTIPALTADQTAALQSDDLDIRNREIAALRAVEYPAAEIGKIAGIAAATVYRIAKSTEPDHGYEPLDQWESVTEDDDVADMSEEFAAEADEAEAEARAAEQADKDSALAEKAEQGITAAYLGADITAYIAQLRHSMNSDDNAAGKALFQVQTTQGEDRRKAIIAAAELNIERKHIAAAAGVKSVGRIIRAARSAE